jgi:hypothetical protein
MFIMALLLLNVIVMVLCTHTVYYIQQADINGLCETKYALMGARETSLVITKKKDIATCTYRYKHHSILQTTPYVFRQVKAKNDMSKKWKATYSVAFFYIFTIKITEFLDFVHCLILQKNRKYSRI